MKTSITIDGEVIPLYIKNQVNKGQIYYYISKNDELTKFHNGDFSIEMLEVVIKQKKLIKKMIKNNRHQFDEGQVIELKRKVF